MKDYSPKLYLITLLLLLGLVLVSVYLFRALYLQQQELINVQENRYRSYLLATQLRRSSDELTRLVRSYAATGNPIFEKQFWEVLSIRSGLSPLPEHYDRVYWDFLALENGTPPYTPGKPESLINLMKSAGFTEEELLLLEKSHKHSDTLVDIEKIAMNAMKGKYLNGDGEFSVIGQPDQRMALDLLYGNNYHNAKIKIMTPINQFYENLDQRTKEQVDRTAKQLDFSLKLNIFIFTLTVSLILLLMLTAKRYHLKMIQRLNKRVEERTDELNRSNHKLQKALDEVQTLKGIIPICSYCHNIRNDEGSWDQIEAYICDHSEAEFSHGICPNCLKKTRAEEGLV